MIVIAWRADIAPAVTMCGVEPFRAIQLDGLWQVTPARTNGLEHRAEKWMPVFGKNDAKTKS